MTIIRKIIFYYLLSNIVIIFSLNAEPFVVMEYATSNKQEVEKNRLNSHKNENYSRNYKIKKNESLSSILNKFYGGKGLNLKIIQTAIILKNKHAFVRNNPNFMYANKKLYLPSIKEIKNLVYKRSRKPKNEESTNTNIKEIYFFGN